MARVLPELIFPLVQSVTVSNLRCNVVQSQILHPHISRWAHACQPPHNRRRRTPPWPCPSPSSSCGLPPPLLRRGFNCFNALSNTLMSLSFFNGDESGSDSKDFGKPQSSKRDLFDGRQWTNILLAANVLVYIAQSVSNGNLLSWGAKINNLISEGQLWRLATSSFLHANIGHLLVNCYSLNSVGPAVENISGARRYLTVYITSAIASSAMSYWFCKAPSVGASGAIFGLVGSFAMFVLRHRGMVKGTEGDLRHIARVIAVNMAIGLLSQGIDNWGHVGGLIGGAAVSWLVGPAWEVESISRDRRKIIIKDTAPIFSLIKRHPK